MKPLTVFLFLLIFLGNCSADVFRYTRENLYKVELGMSPSEVQNILGPPTEQKSSVLASGQTETIFTYRNDQGQVLIIFQNDKVKDKRGTFGDWF